MLNCKMNTEAHHDSLMIRVFVTKPEGPEFDHMVERENSKLASDCLASMVMWHVQAWWCGMCMNVACTHIHAHTHLHLYKH